jgi:hypothetical protein
MAIRGCSRFEQGLDERDPDGFEMLTVPDVFFTVR